MKALIVAGEASGDIYGSQLTRGLLSASPGLSIVAVGGPQMAEAGAKLLFDYGSIAVVGVFEVFSKLKALRQAMALIRKTVEEGGIDFAILIDFPDFNFRVAKLLKKHRIKIFYFISPQIWAWRKNRIHFLKDHVDLMLTILPFEEKLYREHNVPVMFLGHPLREIVESELKDQPEFVKGDRSLIGLMPGSRDTEVRRHLPVLIESVTKLRQKMEFRCALMWPPNLRKENYDIPEEIEVVTVNRYAAMKACDFLFVASGTSTLECAILLRPFFIVYRVGKVSWWLGKLLVRVPYYGLVNWIAGKKVIPEYIQERMSPELLAEDAYQLLHDDNRLLEMKDHLKSIVESLQNPGAIDRAVNAILNHGVHGAD